MNTVAALLDSTAALATVRRTLPKAAGRVCGCRTAAALDAVLAATLVDAVVLGVRSLSAVRLPELRERYPAVPVVVYGAFRAEDAGLLLQLDRLGVRAVLIERIDDPLLGERVAQHGYEAGRRLALADLPRVLRLTEPLQRRAFDLLVSTVGRPPSTAAIARRLRVSREHLSRQFAAGGAPNLKRVADLLRLLAAHDRLAKLQATPDRIVDLFGYSSKSHLRGVIRRVFKLDLPAFQGASQAELVRRFMAVGTRSRQ